MSLNEEEKNNLKLKTALDLNKNMMTAAVCALPAATYTVAKYLGFILPVEFSWLLFGALLIGAVGAFHLLKTIYLFIKLIQIK